MPLSIDNPGRLAPDRLDAFNRLCERVRRPGVDAEYDALKASRKGRIISVDTARFLAPEFATWSGRIRHTPSTATPAGAYAHDRLMRALARTKTPEKRLLITAGGAGSGKTSQLRDSATTAGLVFDNQFKNHARARTILLLALERGWEIEVVYVHRPFPDVVRAVIERSQRTGRWNKLSELPAMHVQAQGTILKLWQEFRGRVAVHAIYNAQAGVAEQTPGSRVLFKTLRQNGTYHLRDDEKTRAIIPKVLDQAIQERLVSFEVARILAQGLKGWNAEQRR